MRSRDLRCEMVEDQLIWRGITDFATLEVMRKVPRELFTPLALEHMAYADQELPIGAGQTMSQPYLVALMTQSALLTPRCRVLEVGTGSGYQAAVLSKLVAEVYTIERHDVLAYHAEQALERGEYRNVKVGIGDGSGGWPGAGPFDAIVVTAAAPAVPHAYLSQLAVGGRLIIPIGPANRQTLSRYIKGGARQLDQQSIQTVSFAPLIGAHVDWIN